MAKSNTVSKISRMGDDNSNKPQEIKIIVELQIPQIGNSESFSNISSPGFNSFREDINKKDAKISIMPVQDIHIVEIEVNTEKLVKDRDVQANQPFNANAKVSPTRPISLFINITGIANTMISIELEIEGKNEFKGDLFIPNSGRLIIQKIIP
jgi:hypothetical protein